MGCQYILYFYKNSQLYFLIMTWWCGCDCPHQYRIYAQRPSWLVYHNRTQFKGGIMEPTIEIIFGNHYYGLPYIDGSRIEHHASEWAVFNVLIVICHMDSPFARLIRLEGSVEGSIIFTDWTSKRPIGWRICSHFQQFRSGCMVRINL